MKPAEKTVQHGKAHRPTDEPSSPHALLLSTLAKIAGIGGLGVGSFFILFLEFIRLKLFSNLGPEQAYNLLLLFLLLTFGIAIGGLAVWAQQLHAGRLTVALLLLFALLISGLGVSVIKGTERKEVHSSESRPATNAATLSFDVWPSLARLAQDRNRVPLSNKYIAVVLYGGAGFNVNDLQLETIRSSDGTGPGTPVSLYHTNPGYDENLDGIPDLKLDFDVMAMITAHDLSPTSRALRVWGTLSNGTFFEGTAAINVQP